MERYDFWFQVCTGMLIIVLASFSAIGVSIPTVEDGKITDPGLSLWASFVAGAFAFPGMAICMYAYWRAKKRAANLGLFFLCWSAYFSFGLIGIRQTHDLDKPSSGSFLVMILTFTMAGVALFVLDYKLVKRFGVKATGDDHAFTGKPAESLAGPTTAWKVVVRMGRLLLFFFCLFLSIIFTTPRFIHEDWPRAVVFLFILLLSCLISGLISEDTVAKFLSFLNLKSFFEPKPK